MGMGAPMGMPPMGMPPMGMPPMGIPPMGMPPIGMPPMGGYWPAHAHAVRAALFERARARPGPLRLAGPVWGCIRARAGKLDSNHLRKHPTIRIHITKSWSLTHASAQAEATAA
jgi:hypothetical protein